MADDRVYRIQLHYLPEEERFVARAPELALEVVAGSRVEALQTLEAEVDAEIERLAVEGRSLPRPADLATEPGVLRLQLSAPVYRDLVVHARAQELEPEALALQLLTRALGQLEGRSGRRARGKPSDVASEAKAEARSVPDEETPNEPRKEGSRRAKGRGRGRGGRREGYRPDMEDQANFLAYVRDQERGGRGRR